MSDVFSSILGGLSISFQERSRKMFWVSFITIFYGPNLILGRGGKFFFNRLGQEKWGQRLSKKGGSTKKMGGWGEGVKFVFQKCSIINKKPTKTDRNGHTWTEMDSNK